MTSLVYPTFTSIDAYTNVLLIDRSVSGYQIFVDSANSTTFPIVYSADSSKTELLAVLSTNFTHIQRIGLCFQSMSIMSQIFLDSEPFFASTDLVTNDIANNSANVRFMVKLIIDFSVINIDYLACIMTNYTNYYDILSRNTSVIVGTPNNTTGNTMYGGEDIELIYFTGGIEYYKYLLVVADSSIIVKNDSTIWGCGNNNLGQLGNGTTTNSSELVTMTNNTGYTPISVVCGGYHTMVLMSDGVNNYVYGCGNNNCGQLGNGTTTNSSTLVAMTNNTGYNPIAISCGSAHTMVLMSNNSVYGCGYNGYGQLGNNTQNDSTILVAMINNTGYTPIAISCNGYYTMVLQQFSEESEAGGVMSDGVNNYVYGCGYNERCQLDNTTQNRSTELVAIINNTGYNPIAISCGLSHTTILMSNNYVYGCSTGCCGELVIQ